MPWKVVKRGSQYVVVNAETGKVKGKHPTKSAAQRQVRALYANVPESRRPVRRRRKK